MSITTSASPVTAQEQSTVPEMRLFQMGAEGASAANTVNLFRGEVGFPLTLLSMENRGGLKTDITLQYSSAVEQAVTTYNQAAPTGIVGLGWSLPYETILLDFQNSGSPADDTYYLATSDGGRSRLWPTAKLHAGTPDEVWTFEVASYRFQRIAYSPARQRWTIVEADGSMRIYGADVAAGDSPAALRTAIKWGGSSGNWTGASARRQGQHSFVVSWNLTKVVNAWGSEIVYSYSSFADDEVQIGGAGGLTYTRAAYLISIDDPTGRTITFNYLPKLVNQAIREYEAPHAMPEAGQWPYQDRYETRYLDSITVTQTQSGVSSIVTTLRFAYSVDLFADTSVVPGNSAYLYKRYLRGITAMSASGKLMPGPRFDYYTGQEEGDTPVHRGALKTVTEAGGGTIDYKYAWQAIPDTALDLTITASEPDWVPGQLRFFPGPDSVVLVSYDPVNSNRLSATIYEWNGRWLHAQPISASLPFNADLTTLQVSFGEDCFVVSVTGATANGMVQAWAVHRVYGRYGEWSAIALDLPTAGTAGTYQVAAGNNYIVAAVAGQSTISCWTWEPRAKRWAASTRYVPTGSSGEWALTAGHDFFALCQYQPGQPLALSLYYLDLPTLTWCRDPILLDTIQTYVWNSRYPKLSLAASQTAVVATTITSVDASAKTFNYTSNTYSWDACFNVQGAPKIISGTDVPFDSVEPVLTSVATPTMVGNASNLIRFDGVDWAQTSMGNFNQGSDVAHFIYAGDLAVGVNSQQNVIAAFNPAQGRFTTLSPSVGGLGPIAPTANGNVVTVRNHVFVQQPDGSLANLGPMLSDAVVAANEAPTYLAYAQQNGTTYVLLVKNGVVGPRPFAVTTGNAFVQPGTPPSAPGLWLVGPQAFVTFVGASLDQASQFTLHRVLDQQLGGAVRHFAVTAVVASDGLGVSQPVVFDYSQASGTVGPYGLASQYDKVVAIAGSDTTCNAPYGKTISYFYNGLDPTQAAPDLLYSTVNGLLWKTETHNSQGALVSQTSSTYETVQSIVDAVSGASQGLIGSYSRVTSSTETFYDINPMSATVQPPLEAKTSITYNNANGQPRTQQTQHVDAATGTLQIAEETFVYAYEQYPAMALPDTHILTPSVLTISTAHGAVTAIGAVTWKTWETWHATAAWAPYRSFQALNPNASLTPSDWANETLPPASQWRVTNQVSARDVTGDVQEMIDADGLARSVVLDAASRFVVASFENGSGIARQVVYLGFERYEDLTGWTLAGSVTALAAAIGEGDSGTGSCALVMGGSAVAQSSPFATVLDVVEKQGQVYVFSCWIKTAKGFASAPGSASMEVHSAWVLLANVAVPDTGGQWQLLALTINVPASATAQSLTLSLSNTKNVTLKVDDVRFSPAMASLATTVYDPVLLTQTATMDATGVIRRAVLGDFGQTSIAVLPDNAPVEIKSAYLSRRSNAGIFSATDPNSVLVLAPRGYAFYQSFNAGDVFDANWSTASPAAWMVSDGSLQHLPGTASTIAFMGYPAGTCSAFGAALRVTPVAATATLTGSVGLRFGASLALMWSPSSAAWVLSDATGILCTAPVRALLQVPSAQYLSALDAGVLPGDFLTSFPLAGLPLATGSTVSVHSAGVSFSVADAASAAVYYLVRSAADPAQISVTVFPRDWVLLVAGQAIALYADGGRVLSYTYGAPIAANVALSAIDALAFDNAVFFTDPGVQMQYLDGLARPRQEQLYDGKSLTARAVVLDNLGRGVIDTLFADVTAAGHPWGSYIANLAVFDWATQHMTGLVVDGNPDAGGYPYSRTRYEDSPLGRKVELGLPGQAYAIVPGASDNHTTRFAYGLNDASFNLAPGKFLTTTVVNPDGVTQVKIEDLRDQAVATASLATTLPSAQQWNTTYTYFDAFSNLVRTITPMGWGDSFTYDFVGDQICAERANEGMTQSIYDALGRLRFQLDPCGVAAATPYIRYWKYDVLSRVTESGCHPVTEAVVTGWPESIASFADNPSYPDAHPSSQYVYDFDPTPEAALSLTALGRLTQVINSRQTMSPSAQADAFSATETVQYNHRGAVVRHTVHMAASPKTTTYAYDNLANVIQLGYPTGLQVAYQSDLLGRVTTVLLGQRRCAAYTYNNHGEIASEASYDDAGNLVGAVRLFNHTPSGWQSDDAGTQFSEMTMYAPWDPGAPGYYSGTPTQTITASRGARSQIRVRYGLDPQGRLASADFGSVDNGPMPFRYDMNGNTLQVGLSQNVYTHATYDRVQSRTDGNGITNFAYNPAGAMTGRTNSTSPEHNLSLAWDGFRDRPITVCVGATAATQTMLDLRYGHQGRRLQKTITAPNGNVTVKHYLRGAGDDALVEITVGGATIELIRGPQGLLQIRQNGSPYFVATDRIGSVRAVVDTSGALIGGYDYLPYGEMNGAALGSHPDITSYRFAGRELEESGLYDFRARLYDPMLGRFISADPRHQFASPYLYAGDEPLIMIDPNGEIAFLLALGIAALIGAVIGAAGGGVSYAISHEGDFNWGDFGKAVGIGLVSGAAAGATGFAAGAAASAGAVALGYAANSVAVGIVGGTVGGAVGGAAGQLTANAIEGRDLGNGLLTATLLGAAIGGLTGGIAARLGNAGDGWRANGSSRHGARGNRFRYLRNRRGRRVWVSRRSTRGSDLTIPVRSATARGRNVTILTGTHGSRNGYLRAERDFYRQDVRRFRNYRNVRIYDIWSLSDHQVRNILQSNDEVIAAFCYSRMNRLIEWGLR